MFTAFYGMRMGRRLTLMLGNICIIIGAIIQATTFSVPQIIVGRIICGFGIGFIASAVPTYMVRLPWTVTGELATNAFPVGNEY